MRCPNMTEYGEADERPIMLLIILKIEFTDMMRRERNLVQAILEI